MKVTTTIALKKEDQKKVAREAKNLRKKAKSGKLSQEERKEKRLKAEETRGLIYVAHLPHGFYEDEISGYFKQFGKVTNVKVCRSRYTGNSKGYAYVEFLHPDVAKVAAETMNNYLMFKKRITAEFVTREKRPKHIFHGKQSMPDKFSAQRRRDRNNACRNNETDQVTHLKKSRRRLGKLNKQIEKINKMGVKYDLRPVNLPKALKQEK